MYSLYSAGLALWLLLSLPYWLLQMLRHGKYRKGLRERLGKVPSRLLQNQKPIIWVHAVSVGEVIAIAGVVERLRQSYPQMRVVVSTTTDTGQRVACQRFGPEHVFYFPLDFEFAIRPYLHALHPKLIVIAETEFWPNFLRLAKKSGAKIAVVNARISDRSLPGYRHVRRWLRRILSNVDLFLAQGEEDQRRLTDIGAVPERIQVAGNLKFDLSVPQPTPLVRDLQAAFASAESWPIVVCGSTTEGEELVLLRAFEVVLAQYPRAVMILAPRHPERFEHVSDILHDLSIRHWLRSQWNPEWTLAGGVFLLDSIGDLAAMYALATIAFVGGSLALKGGHNILEAAVHGVPIVVGPHTENFRDIINLFRARDAVRIAGVAELPLMFSDLLANPDDRTAIGQRALETLRSQAGATERTLAALRSLLSADLESDKKFPPAMTTVNSMQTRGTPS
jgi:3-deoxy-D-manno-octulosonic-acid transferase